MSKMRGSRQKRLAGPDRRAEMFTDDERVPGLGHRSVRPARAIEAPDAAVGPLKRRDRSLRAGDPAFAAARRAT